MNSSPPLLSPPDLTPRVPENATPEQCIRMWMDLLNACEQFLLAGLRREVGPDGDLMAAYRRWNEQQQEEHTQALIHMMREFERRGGGRAG